MGKKHSSFLFKNGYHEQKRLKEEGCAQDRINFIKTYSKVYEGAEEINKILTRILSSNDKQELIKKFVDGVSDKDSDYNFVQDLLSDEEKSELETYAGLANDYIEVIKSSLKQLLMLNDEKTVIDYIWSKDEIWNLENPIVNSLKDWILSSEKTQQWYINNKSTIKPIIYDGKVCVYFFGYVINSEDYGEAYIYNLPSKQDLPRIVNFELILNLLPDNITSKINFFTGVLGLSNQGFQHFKDTDIGKECIYGELDDVGCYRSVDSEGKIKSFYLGKNHVGVTKCDSVDGFIHSLKIRAFLNPKPYFLEENPTNQSQI